MSLGPPCDVVIGVDEVMCVSQGAVWCASAA